MLTTIREFVNKVESFASNNQYRSNWRSHAGDIFEYECTPKLRDKIYSFGDPDSIEPFRSAMINLGFTDF